VRAAVDGADAGGYTVVADGVAGHALHGRTEERAYASDPTTVLAGRVAEADSGCGAGAPSPLAFERVRLRLDGDRLDEVANHEVDVVEVQAPIGSELFLDV
jgi:hypothetical protein